MMRQRLAAAEDTKRGGQRLQRRVDRRIPSSTPSALARSDALNGFRTMS